MDAQTMLGSAGVLLLLIAFFLNMSKKMRQDSVAYTLLNLFGAAILTYTSVLIGFVPFIVLEGIWALVALVGLGNVILKSKKRWLWKSFL